MPKSHCTSTQQTLKNTTKKNDMVSKATIHERKKVIKTIPPNDSVSLKTNEHIEVCITSKKDKEKLITAEMIFKEDNASKNS